MSDQPPVQESLIRQLSGISLWLLMVNGVVGAGIFGLSGELARVAGDAGVWVFPLCALMVLPIVLVFAHLGSRHTQTGGPMLYTSTAFGAFAGFQTGWAFYVARLTAFAANINLLVATLAWFWPSLTDDGSMSWAKSGLLTVLVGLLAAVNILGAKRAMDWLGVITLVKFLPLFAVVGVGLYVMPETGAPAVPTIPLDDIDIGAAILLVVYAFVGFESGLVPAAEARSPQRDIPRALLAALAFAAVLYALLHLVCTHLLPDLAQLKQPVVEAGLVLFGTPGAVLITVGIAASVGGNLLGAMFSSPRITYRLALEGQLPLALGSIHPVHGTPVVSIVCFAMLALILASTGTFIWLASLSVVVRLLIYVSCIAAMASPQTHRMNDGGHLRLPGGWVVPMVALIVCVYLMWQVAAFAWLMSAGLLAAGSVLYGLAKYTGARRSTR